MTTREEFLGKELSLFERSIVFAIRHGRVTGADLAEAKNVDRVAVTNALHRIYTKTGAINMVDLVLMMAGYKKSAADLGVDDGTG